MYTPAGRKLYTTLALALFCLTSACVRAGFDPPQQDGALARPDDLARTDLTGGDLIRWDRSAGPLCASWGALALFCEDMDSPGGQLPASLTANHGTAVIDTNRYFAGRASLRGTTQQSATTSAVVMLDSPASSTTVVTSGDVFLRAHFFFETRPVIPSWAILMESRAKTTASNKAVISVGPGGLLLGHDKGQTPAVAPLPVGRWFCLELQVSVGTSGSARAWLDGQQLAELTSLDTDQGLGHGMFRAGAIVAANSPGFSFNVDDFLTTRSRAGCQ